MYKSNYGIIYDSFKKLRLIENLNKHQIFLIDIKQFLFLKDCDESYRNMNFNIYKLNLFDLAKESNLKISEVLEINLQNLKIILNLDDGDIISFSRGFYSHHAIVTGILFYFFNFLNNENLFYFSIR